MCCVTPVKRIKIEKDIVLFATENVDYQSINVNEENELMIWRISVLNKSDCSINYKNRCVSLQKKLNSALAKRLQQTGCSTIGCCIDEINTKTK